MENETITASRRAKTGTKTARRLRDEGQLPAIVQPHQGDPMPITLPAHDVENALNHGNLVLQLSLDGKEGQYLIKDVQYDYLGATALHLDLAEVDIHEVVEVEVPIELRGTPAGISEGGMLDQLLNELAVRCKVNQIPELLRPSVTTLNLNDSLTAGEIELPEGVEAVTEASEVVATVRPLAAEEEEEEEEVVEGEEGAAEPEVIERGKREEEEGEE